MTSSPKASGNSPSTPLSPSPNRWVDITDEVVGFGLPEAPVSCKDGVEVCAEHADDEHTGEGESARTSSKDNSSTDEGTEERLLTTDVCDGKGGGLVSKAPESLDSIGSKAHDTGRCKPCAFFHTKGCKSGVECVFCHRCPAFEKQRRKRMWRRSYNGNWCSSNDLLWDRGFKSNNHSRQPSGASMASTAVSWGARGHGQHSHSRQTSTSSTVALSETGYPAATQGAAFWPPMPCGVESSPQISKPACLSEGGTSELCRAAGEQPGIEFQGNFDGYAFAPSAGQQVMYNGVQYTLVPVSMGSPSHQQIAAGGEPRFMPPNNYHQQVPYPLGQAVPVSPSGVNGSPMSTPVYTAPQMWY